MRHAMLLVVVFCLVWPASGATINVPGDYPTIQAAINAANPGDVIVVAAGTYAQALTVNKSLTLQGANAGIDPNTGVRGPESVLDFSSVAGNPLIAISVTGTVVIDGFKIVDNNPAGGRSAIRITAVTDHVIKNCIFERAATGSPGITRGIEISPSSTGGVSITSNLFVGIGPSDLFTHRTWTSAIYSNGGGTATSVTSNVFRYCRTAINLDDYTSAQTITGNTFDQNGTAMSFGGVSPTVGTFTIAGNNFVAAVPSTHINLSNVAPSFFLDVTGNTFEGQSTSTMSQTDLYTLEYRMVHRFNVGKNGLVLFKSNNVYVVPPLPTIAKKGLVQEGVDAASTGWTVNVAPGTYTGTVNLNKKVSLVGAGSGTSGTILTKTGGSDGVINLQASGTSASDPLLIKDLRIRPIGVAGISVGIFTLATGTNVSWVKLDSVKVVGTNTNPCTEQERGLYVDKTSSLTHLEIIGSSFDSLTYGWYLHKDVSADASNVRYVSVTGTSFSHNTLKGIYAEKLADATFTNCTIDQNGLYHSSLPTSCSFFMPWLSGIDINLKAGTYQNLGFVNCSFTNNGLGTNGGVGTAKEGTGLALKARGTGSDPGYALYPATLAAVTITGCFFTGNERGIRLGEPGKSNTTPTNVTIHENYIAGNVQTYSGSDGSAYGGVVNLTTAQANASCNWWGAADGPGIVGPGSGDNVFGNVLFSPWLLSGTDYSTDPGFQPTPGSCCALPPVAVDAGNDQQLYIGYGPQSVTLSATATGGTPPYTFLWTPGGPGQSISVSPTATTTYTVTVTDATGCTASDDVVVNVEDVRCGVNLDKVAIWHRTGNGNYVKVCVSPNAIPAHLAHGDVFVLPKSGGAPEQIPQRFALKQNYPNPFNPATSISYDLPVDAQVSIAVYSILGQKVAQVIEGEMPAGVHSITFDASQLASGIYIYRMTARGVNGEHFAEIRKMMVVK